MRIIKYYQSKNQEHWKEEIGRGDWSAAKLLYSWLESDKLKEICGYSTEVYLLTDGDKLVSFAILAEQDEVDAPRLTPWLGFLYTFKEYRGQHCASLLIEHICSILKLMGVKKVYASTQEIGLYEKFGFSFWQMMFNREGMPTKVYVRDLKR